MSFDEEGFKSDFDALTARLFDDDGTHVFYSTEEWQERGEQFGRNALLTIVIEESPWYNVLNGLVDSKAAADASDALEDLMEEHGVWYELGHAWSMHFYEAL
jgi:hypothetical protein